MTVHALKCWPEGYEDVRDGRKTFEFRRNDRDFHAGDLLALHEWDPATQEFTGRSTAVQVVKVYDLGPFGAPGFVAMEVFR